MKSRDINPSVKTEDWEANNIALACPEPECGKVFIVSEQIHGGERKCPACGRSKGMMNGGRKSGGIASIVYLV